MCGIVGMWAREDSIPEAIVDIMFKYNEKRGRDGWGYARVSPYGKSKHIFKTSITYSQSKHPVQVSKNELLLGICRAKPETEVETKEEELEITMQPIERDDYILVHNGSINTYYDDCESWRQTEIDSECIIYQYEKRGYPKFVEHIPGGFAFLLFDAKKNSLIIGVNHMPLYHMYIRGVGYFVSSVKQPLKEILNYYYRANQESYNIWEAWYLTEVSAFTVRQIDLDSGMEMQHKFKPLYLLPKL